MQPKYTCYQSCLIQNCFRILSFCLTLRRFQHIKGITYALNNGCGTKMDKKGVLKFHQSRRKDDEITFFLSRALWCCETQQCLYARRCVRNNAPPKSKFMKNQKSQGTSYSDCARMSIDAATLY